ncbi:uncharacterized protein BJ212DRAFT_1353327 [Suillus subaureus]|uniref:Uncharacterized protein n=1 Tax=Suillus subaureus TaxID=48587 RepID=A0A9P7JDW4_9AGAM|nr:uncharacterized protein BJ212DRAFT_1353327 [Suillus subaureus]KAG1816800.1 hypothetical protein BJ212DRAFT_1353327 [Suillus subaureus]
MPCPVQYGPWSLFSCCTLLKITQYFCYVGLDLTLIDSVIPLNPLKTFILVQACAQGITERGQEVCRIMHSHCHSMSPGI